MTDYIEAATKDEWFARAIRAEEELREAMSVFADYFDAKDDLLCNEGTPGWHRKPFDDAEDRARALLAKPQ